MTPLTFDSLGMDLNWFFAGLGDTATLTPTGAPLAGAFSGASALGLSSGAPAPPGSPLLPPLPVPPIAGAGFSFGGIGYYDTTTFFGGVGLGGLPPLGAVDVFGVTFTATGAPGSKVTLMPSGIFAPGFHAGLPAPPAVPLTSGGDVLYDSATGFTTPPAGFIGGTILIVPEPGTLVLLGAAVGLVFLFRRQRATA